MAVVLNLACKAMNVSYKRTCVEMITDGRGDSAFEVASDNKVVSCSCSEHQVKSWNWRRSSTSHLLCHFCTLATSCSS